MGFARTLQHRERQELKQLARHEVGRVSERIRMILLSSRGYTVPQIAAIFECDEATVRIWIERFEAGGVDGLRDRPRAGRPRKADPVARETIRHELEEGPSTHSIRDVAGGSTLTNLSNESRVHLAPEVERRLVRRDLGFCPISGVGQGSRECVLQRDSQALRPVPFRYQGLEVRPARPSACDLS
jgi:transposase